VASELERIREFALANEQRFSRSSVSTRSAPTGEQVPDKRRSLVLSELGEINTLFRARLAQAMNHVVEHFRLGDLSPTGVDVQMTATNHGEFFRPHIDSSSERFRSRRLSFVYFFHEEPVPFSGGALRLYDVNSYDDAARALAPSRVINPQQNAIVFFPSQFLHEIEEVDVPSRRFADSRFTLNGWIHW
jgi:Rps23 Pro-64 3,4-dihydroxylase Tpa1-like proline 4-hydroxylase